MTTVTVAATQMTCSWDLEANLECAEALVREAAAWSLARGYGDLDARAAIERQAEREDDDAASELRRNLDEPPLA